MKIRQLLLALPLAFGLWPVAFHAARQDSSAPRYEVYAVKFAQVNFGVGQLVAGADRTRRIDIAFMVWVMKTPGRVVLLDSGFYRDKFMNQWKPVGYSRPSDAVAAGLGIAPDQVTDVIISHSHWDHADGADLFPNARIWIQRDEYEYYVGADGAVAHSGGADALDAKMLFDLNAAGRVHLVDGDAKEILPGITAYTGGKHTFQSQYVGVNTKSGIVVLASDNAYLYENLEKHLAIAQTLDAASNLAAQTRMATLAASMKLIVPGHDPAVFERFPVVKPGVVRID
jgi:glyoxylase-like metal-dependent hydrolase (beta-lactamase superfamily II)